MKKLINILIVAGFALLFCTIALMIIDGFSPNAALARISDVTFYISIGVFAVSLVLRMFDLKK